MLVQYFVTKLARRHGKVIDEVPGHIMKELADWTGPAMYANSRMSSNGQSFHLLGRCS
jgi:hypothetical protein